MEKLVLEIKPDLIVMSLKKSYLELLPLDFIKRIITKKSKSSPKRKQLSYVIDLFRLNLDGFKTNLIWGSAQNRTLVRFWRPRVAILARGPFWGRFGGLENKFCDGLILW